MGYCCSRCGGLGGLFESSHLHSDPDSCFGELAEGKKRLLLQIDELNSQKAAHVTIIENAYKGVQNFKKIQAELEESNRLNSEALDALHAIWRRVTLKTAADTRVNEDVASMAHQAIEKLQEQGKRNDVLPIPPPLTVDTVVPDRKCWLCGEAATWKKGAEPRCDRCLR